MHEVLTPREQEILNMLLEGISPKEISNRLNISYATVDFHRSKLYRKLGVHNIQELHFMFKSKKQQIPETANNAEPQTISQIDSMEDQSLKQQVFILPEKNNIQLLLLIFSGILNIVFIVLLAWYLIKEHSTPVIYPMPVLSRHVQWNAGVNGENDFVRSESSSTFHIGYEIIQRQRKEVLTITANLASGPSWRMAGISAGNELILKRLREGSGIRFKVLGDSGTNWEVEFWTDHDENISYYFPIYTLNNKVVAIDIPYYYFEQPDWETQLPLDIYDNRKHITHIVIQRTCRYDSSVSGESTIKIFDFEIY